MSYRERADSERRFLEREAGLLVFDPSTEPTPEVLTTPTIEAVTDYDEATVIEALHISLDALVKRYTPRERAIGVAAPQLGFPLRIAAVDETDGTRRMMISPIVEEASDETEPWRIGCLSLGPYRQISRYPSEAILSYFDENGDERWWNVKGSDAVVPIHEIEHLDGQLITDRYDGRPDTKLFIPRETLYGPRIKFQNWAAVTAIRRALDLPVHAQTTEQYYSQLFRGDAVDWQGYMESHVTKRQELMNLLLSETPYQGRVFEAGCGTSALSVFMSKLGYDVTCIDYSDDMLALAKRCNDALGGSVAYEHGDLFDTKRPDDSFDTVFSHGVLEEVGGPDEICAAINEALRIGERFIFSVPTVWDRSNNLNGTENLWTVQKWQRIIGQSKGRLTKTIGGFPLHPKLNRLNHVSNGALDTFAANVMFCVERA